eukprot:8873702-Pyramimonas_sp.AAC.1
MARLFSAGRREVHHRDNPIDKKFALRIKGSAYRAARRVGQVLGCLKSPGGSQQTFATTDTGISYR